MRGNFWPLASFDRRDPPPYCKLYETLPYLEAYAAHTDSRTIEDPHEAVDGKWKELGCLQFDYLFANDLKPESKLLDLGCGTLRGGRHFIRYLDIGNYVGTDISGRAIEYGRRLVVTERLAAKEPRLIHRRPGEAFFADLDDASFDFILAQSVFTHLPAELIQQCFASVQGIMRESGIFFFTFQCEVKHGIRNPKDFAHSSKFFASVAERFVMRISLTDPRLSHGKRLRDVAEIKAASA